MAYFVVIIGGFTMNLPSSSAYIVYLVIYDFVNWMNRVSMRLAKSLRLLDLAHLFHVSDITCGVVWCFAPIWGCLLYSHKSIGSEGLVVSPLWRVYMKTGNVCSLKGRGISR